MRRESECKDTTFIWNKQTFWQKKFSTILQKYSKTKTQYTDYECIALLRIGQKLSKKISYLQCYFSVKIIFAEQLVSPAAFFCIY